MGFGHDAAQDPLLAAASGGAQNDDDSGDAGLCAQALGEGLETLGPRRRPQLDTHDVTVAVSDNTREAIALAVDQATQVCARGDDEALATTKGVVDEL